MIALDGLSALPGIGLDELNGQAALLTRVDRKYVLSPAELARVLARLPDDALVLEVAGERNPAYESTYLDTPELAAYHAAARRRRLRWKVRTRTYAATDTSFLEVKTRRQAATVKQRTPWPGCPSLGPAGTAYVVAALDQAGIALDASRLLPVLCTRYRRSTVLLPGQATRATVDVGLGWADPHGAGTASWADRVVLETKSAGGPCTLDRALWSLGHRPQPLSKYALGMALLDPGLPRNRWHRLLAA